MCYKIIKCIYSIIMFSIAIFFSIPIRIIKKRKIWIICEQKHMARDNGLALFKYCNKKNNEEKKADVYYIIDKKCSDYTYIKNHENIIAYASFKHYLYYLISDVLIMAFPDSICPSAFLEKVLRITKIVNNKKVYLKHGIIKDDISSLHSNKFKTDLIVTASEKENQYIKEYYGHPSNVVQLLGLSRYDYLSDESKKNEKKEILIMPTWRRWINKDIKNTRYYKTYNDLIETINNKFKEDDDIIFLFYLHNNFQKFSSAFKNSDKVKILEANKYKVNELINRCNIMITDYSSVAFDFAYLNKPIIYFQFDYEEVVKRHYKAGYFSYKNDGFGPVEENIINVINDIREIQKNNYENTDFYSKRSNSFFKYRDKNNCERTYNYIVNNLMG